jgi:outer membrane immunogenic protein
MKKFLLATVAFAALGTATSASAADLAARPYTKAPPMVAAVYDWTGFYIGGNGGYGSARKCWDFVPSTVAGVPTGAASVSEGCHDADGGTAGGQIGYRWQNASWVWGLEAQGNWADFRGSNVSTTAVLAPGGALGLVTNRSRIDAFGLFTGQLGYAWNNTLLYVKGGAAVVSERYSSVITGTGVLLGSSVGDDTRWGGTVGVGLEYGFTPNWSFAVEYDHIFLDNRTVRFDTPAGGFYANDRIGGDVDIITARLNYKWGGPAVARY